MNIDGWIGVDLDGTLAHYDKWCGHTHIGDPIEPMINRVHLWLMMGREVRIFTARAAATGKEFDEFIETLGVWCEKHIGQRLAATCAKDYRMIELWDDRCKQVITNTGIAIEDLFEVTSDDEKSAP